MTFLPSFRSFFFFFNDTATTEIYTLSLHDALPIFPGGRSFGTGAGRRARPADRTGNRGGARSEEHTSELQSHSDLVCRLLLEKKKQRTQAKPAQSTRAKKTATRPTACDPTSTRRRA